MKTRKSSPISKLILIGLVLLGSFGLVGNVYAQENVAEPVKLEIIGTPSAETGVVVKACVELPSAERWWPVFTVDKHADGLMILLEDAKKPETMKSKNRCYEVTVHPEAIPAGAKSITFGLPYVTMEREVDWTSQAAQTNSKTWLEENRTPIDYKVEVVSDPEGKGGGLTIEILSKPEAMSELDAQRLISDSFYTNEIIGWEQEIPLR